MSFLNSWPMWTGLAALGVAVPVLIHLWSRNQKFEIPWAAMELLKKAMIARSRKIQVEDYVLMVLRALALLLIAMALLRPVFNAGGPGGIGGREVGVVIAIDASYSMNHGEPARFEKAIGQVREILATLQEGDPVSVVLMSQQPEVIFRRTGYDATAFNNALDELANTSSLPLNIERNLGLIDEFVGELKTATRECYLITDAQASDWQTLSDQARSSLRKIGEDARLVLTPVPTVGIENLAITNFTYSAGSLQRGGSARFTANVRNTGALRVEGTSVEFSVEGTLKAREDLPPIESGKTRSVSFFTSFNDAGDVALTARLSKDGLADDNERFVIAKISPTIRVLCVDGDLPSSSRKDPIGGYYLVRALQLRHAVGEDAPVKVTHIDPSDLFREKLTEYDLVVLVDVPSISKEFGKRLAQFTDGGGG
ncbi:MAG: VWA domain-containing protein, partial [Proteobacteria bacterium]|nr:VWA domain-containing protein [Pseudomonadota bacterium]